jgi:putative peptidoglycan lipid II flippase
VTAPTKTVGRAALAMSAVTAGSRVIGFGRVLVIAAVLGASGLGDAFQGSNSFSNVVFELLAAGALSAVLVPTFVRLVDAGDDAEAERLAGGLLWYAVVGLGALAMVGVAAAPWLARLVTTGVTVDVARHRELTTYLLRWFIPQIVLYGFAAMATAALYARRKFAITAAAPIANTLVVVAALAVFRAAVGSDPGFDLDSGARVLLGVAGTGGVVGFVAVLFVASHRAGFRLVPRRVSRRDAAFRALLVHSAWGVALQAIVGLLLGAAIVIGGSVRGGVVAYQAAFVFFLAPYAILAQPLQTAVLPHLAVLAGGDRHREFVARLRWALRCIANLTLPATALIAAVASPAMTAARVGALDRRGADLIAAGLVGLIVGLLPYGTFLLLARASYALDDSRAPARIAIMGGVSGVAAMVIGAALTDDSARIAVLGLGHSVAYGLAAVALLRRLSTRLASSLFDRSMLAPFVASLAAGATAWIIARIGSAPTRVESIAAILIALGVGVTAYVAAMRMLRAPLRPAFTGAA